ncbi:uncharacterized protein Z518_01297 [Rhinocladiella mackenziei CBS 650.93]|uniref:WSC domain-containing protein n=1 Tax=Rhinocladiella mackenziei CBS 650.93 TaxID=1442369 RepID=A0A0D2J3D6_9EURO|nr:uncharacterized protein Z518_01297 [Rhinocladiella mackenziei CBS 650.93]KIX10216.1 hypothetical protein Z518_01297 [Rhinocladiella mackenziei CBS 650.93]
MLTSQPRSSSGAAFPFLVAVILSLTTRSHGLDISYCSPENNAGDYPAYYNLFQSNGACQDHCQESYAFAVLQGAYCWCSDYVPAEQESTNNCNEPCPGYPDDLCGSTESDLYGYYLLSSATPLGTSGTVSSTSSPTSSPLVSTSLTDTGSLSPSSDTRTTYPSSSVVTVRSSQSSDEASYTTSSSDASTTSTTSSTSSYRSSTDPATTSPPSNPTPASSPSSVYTSITTVTGEVRTVVITPSATTDATLSQASTGGGGVSTGKLVGIVVGVALGIGALIGIGVWLWFRRRQMKREMGGGPETTFMPRTGDSSPSNNIPSRQVSQLSSSGLLGSKIPRINTSGISLGNDPRSADNNSSGFDRRSLGTDQRLNPYALYIHDESRLSSVSLQDNQDYSRQLRVSAADTLVGVEALMVE